MITKESVPMRTIFFRDLIMLDAALGSWPRQGMNVTSSR
jgi:hypothetical protein